MRIAYLCTDPGVPYGGGKGASVHVAELTGALAEEGAEVLVLAASVAPGAEARPPGIAPSAEAPPAGVTVEVLPGPGGGSSAPARLAAEAERCTWIAERVARFGAHALYERLALHSAAGSGVAALLGIPHLVELNAPLLNEARRYRRLEEPATAAELERRVLTTATRVLAVSRPLADHATARGAPRVEVLPNAVDVERYPERLRPHGAAPVALFIGRVRPWHGVETIAAAWELLGDTAPRLLVAGEPGDARRFLEDAGAELLGPLPPARMPAVLAGADIGLAPYAAAAPDYFSPLKLFEYMGAGLAVVAADLPGVRDVVSDATAVVVPPGEAGALAEAVAGLAADRGRRERLGRAARALVAAEHTWRHRARRVIELAGRPAAGREAVA
jgi:glycosyltransferase involved in cell wall biosynthesis